LTENQQEDIMLSSLMQRFGERRAAEFEAEGSAEAGFTLIELMVVLLILAILLAIAIPTFLGVTGSANDRAAQSNLNTALTNAKVVYQQNNQAYPTTAAVLAQGITSNEPSLPMITGTSLATTQAGYLAALASTDGNGAIVFSLAKKTSECWWVADNPGLVVANGPWVTLANTGSPQTVVGVPVAQGIFYGVYKVAPTGTCDTGTLKGATSNVSTTAFPAAA
jgi:type IV pilus assembly protein PilA